MPHFTPAEVPDNQAVECSGMEVVGHFARQKSMQNSFDIEMAMTFYQWLGRSLREENLIKNKKLCKYCMYHIQLALFQ